MPSFESKYAIGDNLQHTLPDGSVFVGTVWSIEFTSDMPPKYHIEELEGASKWTERYWSIHENHLQPAKGCVTDE